MTLVAVSKTVPAERLRAAVAAGHDVLGENRVQEAAAKMALVPGPRWHLVGPLQANKARRAVELFDVLEAVDSVALAHRLDRLSAELRPGRPLPVLLEVNVDADPGKSGFAPATIAAELRGLLALANLQVRGLMTIGRLAAAPDEARATFRRLRELATGLRAAHPGPGARAVDGDERRLRGGDRGGGHDRPRRPGALRRAAPGRRVRPPRGGRAGQPCARGRSRRG